MYVGIYIQKSFHQHTVCYIHLNFCLCQHTAFRKHSPAFVFPQHESTSLRPWKLHLYKMIILFFYLGLRFKTRHKAYLRVILQLMFAWFVLLTNISSKILVVHSWLFWSTYWANCSEISHKVFWTFLTPSNNPGWKSRLKLPCSILTSV